MGSNPSLSARAYIFLVLTSTRIASGTRQSVKNSAEVLEHARRKAIELDAGKAGIEIAESEEGERIRVRDAVATYLKEIEPPQREPKTYKAYKHCLELFAQTCRKTYLQEVTRDDLLHFIRKLYELGCGQRRT